VYPVSTTEDGVKIQPENMVQEKLYHCVFKDKILLFFKDTQEVLNCYEIEEQELVQKIKSISNKDEIEIILEDYIKQNGLKH
jgi:hypothetical protein